jgi:hypothetical protein
MAANDTEAFTLEMKVPAGVVITATATKMVTGDTSEFS